MGLVPDSAGALAVVADCRRLRFVPLPYQMQGSATGNRGVSRSSSRQPDPASKPQVNARSPAGSAASRPADRDDRDDRLSVILFIQLKLRVRPVREAVSEQAGQLMGNTRKFLIASAAVAALLAVSGCSEDKPAAQASPSELA
jgi:hypothetical protein